ncbi:metallophosphoesterase family protein [Chondromyces crocatus]|uniref:Phosphoesterase n=1 Tax=Chondromyces crocatus TaxID=52 RepID=A0A0K1EHH9_CHOCO|nr:metallophosphoesterase [Chondromyces crocatus]AKT40048.1 phosphoesterase [Chondromyces crocatus]
MELVFALVTDLHFGPQASFGGKLRKLTADAPALARAFVSRMNEAVRPDFVVNLGDDIEDEGFEADRARYGACIETLRGVQAELVNVAGNHDLVHLRPADLLAAWGKPELPGLHYSFDRGGFHFVVLHTREKKDVDVTVGEAQIRWLAEDLAAARGPTVVFMHHSAADQDLRGNRWFEGSPHICLVEERRALRSLFQQHGVRAVFNGHLHWNHLDVIAGIPYVTVQSLIENLDEDAPGRPAAAHAVVRVTPERVIVEIEGAERARYQVDRAG